MGNEVSGYLVPNDKERNSGKPAQPAWLGTSMNNISFAGNADAMRSFDERGGGRRVAANLADDAFGGFEDDKDDADDLGGGTHYRGGNDAQKGVSFGAPSEAAENKQQANTGDFDNEEAPKKYTWREIPEVTLPIENDCLFVRRAAPGTGLQRKTRKIVEQFTTKEEVFELQGQEQQRALDLQRQAIEKVLIAKHSHMTKKGKEEMRLQAAVSEAKTTALAVKEYATYSSNMFLGYEDWVRRQKSGQ